MDEHTGSPSYDPTLWLLARDGSTPVGALTGSVLGGNGWVDYLATSAIAVAASARHCSAARSRHSPGGGSGA